MVRIHLFRLGAVPPRVVQTIASGIDRYLGAVAITHSDILDPDAAFDLGRGQYHATHLLERLEAHCPGQRVLGLTEVDLFIPIFTFVFGQARLCGPGAILSLRRLSPTFYGLPDNPERTLQRAVTETIHELGHTFNLRHCPDYACVMHASRLADDIDLKSPSFCIQCARSLYLQQLQPKTNKKTGEEILTRVEHQPKN